MRKSNLLFLTVSSLSVFASISDVYSFSLMDDSERGEALFRSTSNNLQPAFDGLSAKEIDALMASKQLNSNASDNNETEKFNGRGHYANEGLVTYDENGSPKVSKMLNDIHGDVIEMNELVYHLVKGDVALSDQDLVRLEANGWQRVGGFSGLEGRFGDFGDILSGYVMYHPEKNVATIVYHGTATIDDGVVAGWETNFDAEKFKSFKLESELVQDNFLKMQKMLEKAKGDLKAKDYKALKQAMNKDQLESILYNETFDLKTMIAYQAVFDQNIKSLRQKMDKKSDKSKTKAYVNRLLDEIETSFALKKGLIEDAQDLGFGYAGQTHKGFTKKYLSTKREMLELMREVTSKHKDVKFVFSGHSQAGGTGNLALLDIAKNHGEELFGEGFDNKKDARLYGMFFSAARAGDKDYKKEMHSVVGEEFILNQNVHGDPVPIASGDKDIAAKLKGVPVLGEYFQSLANYDDTGMLLLDDPDATFNRAKELYIQEGRFSKKEFDEFEEAMRYVASWAVDPNSIPEFLLSPEEKKEGVKLTFNPLSWLSWASEKVTAPVLKASEYYTIVKLGNNMRKALGGDKEALAKVSAMLEARYAHLHYGFHLKPEEGEADRGAVFTKGIVGRDLNQMLRDGIEQRSKKK